MLVMVAGETLAVALSSPAPRLAPAPRPICGRRSALALRASARASASRAAAAWMLLLSTSAFSTSVFSTGSLNASHQAPRACASEGTARVKPAGGVGPCSLNWAVVVISGTPEGTVAQPASTRAAISGSKAVRNAQGAQGAQGLHQRLY
jgi:hypothetical protein